jgi:hypothetical protein
MLPDGTILEEDYDDNDIPWDAGENDIPWEDTPTRDRFYKNSISAENF